MKGNKIDKILLIYSFLGRNEDFGLLRYIFLKLRIIWLILSRLVISLQHQLSHWLSTWKQI